MCTSIFSMTFDKNIAHSKRTRYEKKMYTGLHGKSFRPLITKLEFLSQIFEKSSNIELNKNPSSGSHVIPCTCTDRQDEATSCFSQFCEQA
jgi:hypothetical protein